MTLIKPIYKTKSRTKEDELIAKQRIPSKQYI